MKVLPFSLGVQFATGDSFVRRLLWNDIRAGGFGEEHLSFLMRQPAKCIKPLHCIGNADEGILSTLRKMALSKELERVIEAACGSCVDAIRHCGTDPKILWRQAWRGEL